MAETMRDNKVTINPDTNQYHLVVFLMAGSRHIIICYNLYSIKKDIAMIICQLSLTSPKLFM
jgi:hypothetical protein